MEANRKHKHEPDVSKREKSDSFSFLQITERLKRFLTVTESPAALPNNRLKVALLIS